MKSWGGIMKEESSRRNGGEIMKQKTSRKHGGRNMGEETWRMNHKAGITGGESWGGIVEEDHKAATIGNLGSIGNVSGKHLGNIR